MEDGEPYEPRWTLYIDKASSSKGSRARVILEKEREIVIDLSIKFDFLVSNNQVEYEALKVGLRLPNDVGDSRLTICSDSQIVTLQINWTYQAKDVLLQSSLQKRRI